MHIPVLVSEFLEFFRGLDLRVFCDGTVGAGGHAKALLQEHPEIEIFIGYDKDIEAIKIAKETLSPWRGRVKLIHGSFVEIKADIDGCLLDLGSSSMQFDEGERGFSFSKEGPLDMRMDRTLSLTAGDVVNGFSREKLGTIFRDLGEERFWKKASLAIVEARKKRKIETTSDLVEVLRCLPRRGKINPVTRIFQALRIFINRELEDLEIGLRNLISHLNVNGRIAIISFHSLEDRIVKNGFRKAENFRILTKKPVQSTREEVRKNPRSRSAKMRVGEKLSYE